MVTDAGSSAQEQAGDWVVVKPDGKNGWGVSDGRELTVVTTLPAFMEVVAGFLNEARTALNEANRRREEAEAERDALKTQGALMLLDLDARTAALLQIVRRRAGSPEFEWCRKYAMAVLSDDDHKMSQERVDAITGVAVALAALTNHESEGRSDG